MFCVHWGEWMRGCSRPKARVDRESGGFARAWNGQQNVFFYFIFRSIIYTYFISGLLLLVWWNLLPYSGYGLYTRYDPCVRKNTHKITIYVNFSTTLRSICRQYTYGDVHVRLYVHYVHDQLAFFEPLNNKHSQLNHNVEKNSRSPPSRPFIIFSIDNKQKKSPPTPKVYNDCKFFVQIPAYDA